MKSMQAGHEHDGLIGRQSTTLSSSFQGNPHPLVSDKSPCESQALALAAAATATPAPSSSFGSTNTTTNSRHALNQTEAVTHPYSPCHDRKQQRPNARSSAVRAIHCGPAPAETLADRVYRVQIEFARSRLGWGGGRDRVGMSMDNWIRVRCGPRCTLHRGTCLTVRGVSLRKLGAIQEARRSCSWAVFCVGGPGSNKASMMHECGILAERR
jgi:hypothetical protein